MHLTWYLITSQKTHKGSKPIHMSQLIYGSISRRAARTNFGTAIIQPDKMTCTDDKTPCICSENIDVTLEKLEEVGKILF